MVRIDRCVCFSKTFAELKQIAEAQNVQSLRELQRHCVFGEKCQMCHPYVEAMLETGQTVFTHLLEMKKEEEPK